MSLLGSKIHNKTYTVHLYHTRLESIHREYKGCISYEIDEDTEVITITTADGKDIVSNLLYIITEE